MAKKSGVQVTVQGGGKDVLILSTGVVLKLRTVPAWKMNDVNNEIPHPEIPKVAVDGDRMVENPDDPDYQIAVKKYEQKMSDRLNDMMIVFGTSFLSKPESMEGPEDKDWLEALEWSGTKVGERKTDRYRAWVKYHAAPRVEDIKKIIQEVGRRSGVSEADVKTAADNFRGVDKRETDN